MQKSHRLTREVFRRRLSQAVMGLYAAATLGCCAMVVGPVANDAAIAAHPGRALARVTAVGDTRVTVEFQDGEGIYHSPPAGLLYPGGLGKEQLVWVSYDRTNPDLVKVEGRGWTLALVPALSTWVVSTFVAVVVWVLIQCYVGGRAVPGCLKVASWRGRKPVRGTVQGTVE